jgi:hypothetical protein
LCRCNRTERRCNPKPVVPGTPCGKDDEYYFQACNVGPGVCLTSNSRDDGYGVCVGTPTVGASCDDFRECTRDDTCKLVTTFGGLFTGSCIGEFDAAIPCSDDEECTINDRYFCLLLVRCKRLLKVSAHVSPLTASGIITFCNHLVFFVFCQNVCKGGKRMSIGQFGSAKMYRRLLGRIHLITLLRMSVFRAYSSKKSANVLSLVLVHNTGRIGSTCVQVQDLLSS